MHNIIYGLRDPRNDVYQYIGKSTVGNKRALKHLSKSHSEKVNEWVESLYDKWLYPKVDIIEEVTEIDDLPEREKYWINFYYKTNPNLLNIKCVDNSINKIRNEEDEKRFNFLQDIVFKIPEILKNERLYRNIKQSDMAKEMGINRSTLSSLENGGNVNLKTIQQYILTLKGMDIITKSISDRAH